MHDTLRRLRSALLGAPVPAAILTDLRLTLCATTDDKPSDTPAAVERWAAEAAARGLTARALAEEAATLATTGPGGDSLPPGQVRAARRAIMEAARSALEVRPPRPPRPRGGIVATMLWSSAMKTPPRRTSVKIPPVAEQEMILRQSEQILANLAKAEQVRLRPRAAAPLMVDAAAPAPAPATAPRLSAADAAFIRLFR